MRALATAPARPDLAYELRRAHLREQYAAIPAGTPVRLAKRTSNLFRARSTTAGPGLDVAAFDGVLSVDPLAGTADVQGMTTYEHLVDATLAHGLMPLVVPQLKTITLGGAVTGLGIECGLLPQRLPARVRARARGADRRRRDRRGPPRQRARDLFHGFPNSYGTLGYALRLTIELEPVRPYVRLRHVPFDDADAYFAAVARDLRDALLGGASRSTSSTARCSAAAPTT